jgi:hypothetical protein
MAKDYEALRRRILGKFGSLGAFADSMGFTASTLSCKLNGKSDWTRAEIEKAAELLELTPEEVLEYFF